MFDKVSTEDLFIKSNFNIIYFYKEDHSCRVLRTVRNPSPASVQTDKLACHRFKDADRGHEALGPGRRMLCHTQWSPNLRGYPWNGEGSVSQMPRLGTFPRRRLRVPRDESTETGQLEVGTSWEERHRAEAATLPW